MSIKKIRPPSLLIMCILLTGVEIDHVFAIVDKLQHNLAVSCQTSFRGFSWVSLMGSAMDSVADYMSFTLFMTIPDSSNTVILEVDALGLISVLELTYLDLFISGLCLLNWQQWHYLKSI